jgi:ArsR family transcriptional regulator
MSEIPQRLIGQRCCLGPADLRLDNGAASLLADDFRLLADPIRLQILDMLGQRGEVCVCDLEAALPVKQPTVSHHLRLLRQAGLVAVRRKGLWAHYHLQADGAALRRDRLLTFLQSIPEASRFDISPEATLGR